MVKSIPVSKNYEDSFHDSCDLQPIDTLPERDLNSSPCGDQGSEETEIEQDYGEPNDDLDVSPTSPHDPAAPLRCQEPVAEEQTGLNTITSNPFKNPEVKDNLMLPGSNLTHEKTSAKVSDLLEKVDSPVRPEMNTEEDELKVDLKEDAPIEDTNHVPSVPEHDKKPRRGGRAKNRKYSEPTLTFSKFDNPAVEHPQASSTPSRTSSRRIRNATTVTASNPPPEQRCRRSLRSDPYALMSPPELSSHGSNDSHNVTDKNESDYGHLDAKHLEAKQHEADVKACDDHTEINNTDKMDEENLETTEDVTEHTKSEKRKRGRRKKNSGDHHPSYISPLPPAPLQICDKVDVTKMEELDGGKDTHRVKESRLWLSISANEKNADQKHTKNNSNVYDVFEFRDSEDEEITFERDLQQSSSKDRHVEPSHKGHVTHDQKHTSEKSAEKHVDKNEKHSEKHVENLPEKASGKSVEKLAIKQPEKVLEKHPEKEAVKTETVHEKEKKHEESKHKSHEEKDLSNKEYVTELSQHGKLSITIRLHQRDSMDGNITSTAEVVKTSEAVSNSGEEPKVEHVKPEKVVKPEPVFVETPTPVGRQTRKSSRLNAQHNKTTIDEVIEDVVKGNIRNQDGTVTETTRPTRRTRASRRSEESVRVNDEPTTDLQVQDSSKGKNEPMFIIPDNKVKDEIAKPAGFQSSPPRLSDGSILHDNDTPKAEPKISLRSIRIFRTAQKSEAKDSHLEHKEDGTPGLQPGIEDGHPPVPVMKVELPKIPGKKENGDDDSGDSRSSPTVLIDPVTGFLTPVAKKAEEAAKAAAVLSSTTESASSIITSTGKVSIAQSVITANVSTSRAAITTTTTTTTTTTPSRGAPTVQPVTIKIANTKHATDSAAALAGIVTSAHISSHSKELLPPPLKQIPANLPPPPLMVKTTQESKIHIHESKKEQAKNANSAVPKSQGAAATPSHPTSTHSTTTTSDITVTTSVTTTPIVTPSTTSSMLLTQSTQPSLPIAQPVPGWPHGSLAYPGFGPLSPHVMPGSGHMPKTTKQEGPSVVCHSGNRAPASNNNLLVPVVSEAAARSAISPSPSHALPVTTAATDTRTSTHSYSNRNETNVITSSSHSKERDSARDIPPAPEDMEPVVHHSMSRTVSVTPPTSSSIVSARAHIESSQHHGQVAFPGIMPSAATLERTKDHHRPSKSPHMPKHSPTFLPQAGFLPGYDAAVHSAGNSAVAGSGVIAELLQNQHYMAAAAAAAAAASNQFGSEHVSNSLGRANTPASASHTDIASRLGNPTPPHTPTPPVTSATHLLQPPDLHPAHVAAGLHLRHSGQPPLLVSPHPHLAIHPELNAYFSQQMMLAAHPHYAELRAQQEAQVRAAMGIATRFGYPAMATAASPASNFRQPVEPRLPHPSAAESKSDGKPSVETAKVPADRLVDGHSIKGMKGDIERKAINVDVKRLEEGELHPSGLDSKHLGNLRPPHVPYPAPVRQLSPHISVSPHERITDSPAVANLYAQGQMRVNAPHHPGRPSQQQQLPQDERNPEIGRHKIGEPEMKPPAAHQNPPSTISQYSYETGVHKAVSLERGPHTRGVLALKREPLQINPSSSAGPTLPFAIKPDSLQHLAEAHKGVAKDFLNANTAALAGLGQAAQIRMTMFPGMMSPNLIPEQTSRSRGAIPTPQRGSEAPVHQPSPARAVLQPTGLTRTQPQTPPHASQVPAQGDTFLLQRYPVMWQGLLALKNDQAAVQMHFVSGNSRIAQLSLPTMSDGGTPPVRITQRMRLEQTQLEGVARKMQMRDEHCILLALPCGRDHMDVLQQSNNLRNGFINYLQLKQAAGIVNAAAPGSQQPAYVIHIFPSCDFSDENMARIAPDLLHSVSDIAHLLIIIATV